MSHRRDDRRLLGNRAEELAARRLQEEGFEILDTNVRVGRGELDIVARKDSTLYVVEVRSVMKGSVQPIETIDKHKQERLFKAAQQYLQSRVKDFDEFHFIVAEVLWKQQGTEIRFILDPFPVTS